MSIKDDLIAATQELDDAQQRLSIAGGVLVASLSVAATMRNSDADVWRVVAMKRLAKLSRANSAGILAMADQLSSELRDINNR